MSHPAKTVTLVTNYLIPIFLESKMSRQANPKIDPPAHLTGDALAFWTTVQRDYSIHDPAGLRLLRLACEAMMTAETARLAIARDGLTYVDRFSAPRPRSESRIQVAAMTVFRSLCRELRLDPPEAAK